MISEDNTGLKYTCMGLNVGFFGIASHLTGRAPMHVVVPNSAEQDYGVLDSVAISCSRLDGTGLG